MSAKFSILVCATDLLQLSIILGSFVVTDQETKEVLHRLSQLVYIQFPFLVIFCWLHFQNSVEEERREAHSALFLTLEEDY